MCLAAGLRPALESLTDATPMDVEPLAIPDVKLVRPKRHGDARGFFSEVYRADRFEAAGLKTDWVQDNHSFSQARGVVRGLHFQAPPYGQAKLVRVARGAVFDVAVDLRRGSPTYGRWAGAELSAENWTQLYVPEGFAHGFCTLVENTEVLYKVSGIYAPDSEGGLRWDDPALGIDWPIGPDEATVSPRDAAWADFTAFETPFHP